MAAALALGAVALYPVVEAGRSQPLVLPLAALAVALLVVGLLGVSGCVLAALVLAAGEYAAWLAVDGRPLDPAAPLVAAGLALAAELAYRSLEARGPVPPADGENWRRAADALGVAAAGAAIGVVVLGVGDSAPGGGGVLEVIAVAAAVAALALVAWLSRSEVAVDSARGPGSPR